MIPVTLELQVQNQQLERCVTYPLADAERRGVDAIGALVYGGERVRQAEAAIVVAVPVQRDRAARA